MGLAGITFRTFLLFVAGFAFLSWYKPALPDPSDISAELINTEPVQEKITIPPIKMDLKDIEYEITPLYSYKIYGLVVEQYTSANWLDIMHKKDPANTRDLCLLWGKNVEDGIYKNLKFAHGEFTCYVKWENSTDSAFDLYRISNNHILPANAEVTRKIGQMQIGDQIYVEGYLSTYKNTDMKTGEVVGTRGTSVTREDTGNGACETIYVTDAGIIQGGFFRVKPVREALKYGSIIFFGLTVFLFFVDPFKKKHADEVIREYVPEIKRDENLPVWKR